MQMAELSPESLGSHILDSILQYGLFIGAIFQLVCIFAVVLVPHKEDDKDDTIEEDSPAQTWKIDNVSNSNKNPSSRKHEKKKRK